MASGSERAPIQFTSVLNDNAARIACKCESMSPGITVRLPRSIVRVCGPACLRISASLPTASTRPSRIAIARAMESRESTVTPLAAEQDVSRLRARGAAREQRPPEQRRDRSPPRSPCVEVMYGPAGIGDDTTAATAPVAKRPVCRAESRRPTEGE
jgi:hypothetical protein